MNICQDCRKPFELVDNVDYCPRCRILWHSEEEPENEWPIISDDERELAISLYGTDWWRYI